MTTSKYLCSTECSLKQGQYKITMRVNKERPRRQEGESLEDPEVAKRKLDRCYLVVHFEGKDGRQTTANQSVTKPHQFEICSPQMEAHEPNHWYEVVIDIFEDEKKVKKLGVHHQLVYAAPTSTLGLSDPLLPS